MFGKFCAFATKLFEGQSTVRFADGSPPEPSDFWDSIIRWGDLEFTLTDWRDGIKKGKFPELELPWAVPAGRERPAGATRLRPAVPVHKAMLLALTTKVIRVCFGTCAVRIHQEEHVLRICIQTIR